jgi:membrane-bound inhibitor of C-type lysozyme
MRRLIGAAMLLFGGYFAGVELLAQEPRQPANPPPATPPQNEVRRAIRWKEFQYSCDGGTKVTVYLSGSLAKVLFRKHQYLMKQTVSADGTRYSDGKLLWWSKGEGGFLQEDTPDGDGKMVAPNCKLETKSTAGETKTP